MSRLIDADKFKEYIVDGFEQNKDLFTDEHRDFVKVITCGFLKDIDEQPTIFDMERVVKQLEAHAIEFEAFGICSDYVELSHAIEIVKGSEQ